MVVISSVPNHQQFGWRYAAAHLRCRGGPGRRANHQIGDLGHIDASFGQSCDDSDRPCMSGGPTTTENQSNVFNHLPTILAREHRAGGKQMKLLKTVFEEERGKSNGVWKAPIVHQELSDYGHSAWKLDGLLSLAPSNLMGWASNLGSPTCKVK
jgi:hypothetical protein